MAASVAAVAATVPAVPGPSYVCQGCGEHGHWTNACGRRPVVLTAEEEAVASVSKRARKKMVKRKVWKMAQIAKKQRKRAERRQGDAAADAAAAGEEHHGEDDTGDAGGDEEEEDEEAEGAPSADVGHEVAVPSAVHAATAAAATAPRKSSQTPWQEQSVDPQFLNKIQRRARARELAATAGVKIVIDLSYTDDMADGEQRSLKTQVKQAYGTNLRRAVPASLFMTSVAGRTAELLGTLAGFPDHWEITVHPSHFSEVFPAERLVVLSPDSPNVLSTLDTSKYYVVGGLVDKLGQVGKSLRRAQTHGLATARLPIAEHVRIVRSNRLPINQVTSILADVAHSGDWAAALLEHIPKSVPRLDPPPAAAAATAPAVS